VTGHWYSADCVTPGNAKYALPLTLNIYDETNTGVLLASATQTFNVSYRPSASAKCGDGRWYSSADKTCFNGLAQNVTFTNFTGNTTLPDTVVYGVTYNTTHYGSNPIGEGAACFTGPGGCFYDSLNVAVTPNAPSIGTDLWGTAFGTAAGVFTPVDPDYTPAVQFKAGS
jgi:hypothetical protein